MRIDPIIDKGYSEDLTELDPRFLTMNIPIISIAVSSGQDDSGVFELNFRDERFMPFEGEGVISKWRLELPDPKVFRPFDYDTISDAILTMRYTAVDGGNTLKEPAEKNLEDYLKGVVELSQEEGLFMALDLKNDFPNEEWQDVLDDDGNVKEKTFNLNRLQERLPYFTKGAGKTAKATDISLLTTSEISTINGNPEGFKLTTGEGDSATTNSFGMGAAINNLHELVIREVNTSITDWVLKIPATPTSLDKAWLIVRYVLTSTSVKKATSLIQ